MFSRDSQVSGLINIHLLLLISKFCLILLYLYFADPEFYPFGRDAGDKKLLPGIVINRTTSAELKLPSKFPFFARDEDTLYVSFKVENCMFKWRKELFLSVTSQLGPAYS